MASRGQDGRRQLEVDTTTTVGFVNNDDNSDNSTMTVTATSPTSSQGSWVVDFDEGWGGLGAVPVPRSPEARGQHQHQHQQHRRLSPASSSLRGWAQVPASPPAAEYPAMMTNIHSPPQSPGSVRSVSSAGSAGSTGRAAAGEGLVALARDQNQNQNSDEPVRQSANANVNVNLMDISDVAPSSTSSRAPAAPVMSPTAGVGIVPRSLPFETLDSFETFEVLETQGFDQGSGGRSSWAGGAPAGMGAGPRVGVGCTSVDGVNEMEMDMETEMDMDVADFGDVNPAGGQQHQHHQHQHAFVMRAASGMTAAEAVEAIAEAAELRGITPTSVVLSHTQVSPPRASSGGGASLSPTLAQDGKDNDGHAQEMMFRHGHNRSGHSTAASYRSTPPRNSSPTSAGASVSAASAGVAGIPDVDAAGVAGSRVPVPVQVPTGSAGTPTPTRIPIDMDATVGIDVDVDVDVDVNADGKYDGKHMDRLWRWTGLITAAKMGVIPIIVCATVAALSTQTGGGGDRGEGRGGGGGGGGRGGGGGGGGGTRCFSKRRPRGGGGGGGGGCFPDARIDRCGMPMPYCVAPSVACA